MDPALDSSGDLRAGFGRLDSQLAATAQRVRLRIEKHLGDWPFDLDVGLPFEAWRAQKPPRVEEIGALVKREIRAVPGVLRIDDWSGTWDPDQRRVKFEGTVVTAEGTISLRFVPVGAMDGNHFPALVLFPVGLPIAPALA